MFDKFWAYIHSLPTPLGVAACTLLLALCSVTIIGVLGAIVAFAPWLFFSAIFIAVFTLFGYGLYTTTEPW
jgi:hypothetical protein